MNATTVLKYDSICIDDLLEIRVTALDQAELGRSL
jgi:hypothetical protein